MNRLKLFAYLFVFIVVSISSFIWLGMKSSSIVYAVLFGVFVDLSLFTLMIMLRNRSDLQQQYRRNQRRYK